LFQRRTLIENSKRIREEFNLEERVKEFEVRSAELEKKRWDLEALTLTNVANHDIKHLKDVRDKVRKRITELCESQ